MSEFEGIVAEYPDSVFNSLTMIDTARFDEGSRSLYMVVKGEAECRLNDFNDTASAPFLSAARHYDLKEDKRRGGKAHFLAGQASFNAGVYDRAILEYMKAADRSMESGDTLWAAFARRGLAQSFAQLSDWARALEYSRQAEQDFRLLGETSRAAYMKYNVANCLSAIGEIESSVRTADEVVKIADKIGNRRLKALCYSVNGHNYLLLKEYRRSVDCYELQMSTDSLSMSGDDYNYLGVAYGMTGEQSSKLDRCRDMARYMNVRPSEMEYVAAVSRGDNIEALDMLNEMFSDQGKDMEYLFNKTLIGTLLESHQYEETQLRKEVMDMRSRHNSLFVILLGVVIMLICILYLRRIGYEKRLSRQIGVAESLRTMLLDNQQRLATVSECRNKLELRNASLKQRNENLHDKVDELTKRTVEQEREFNQKLALVQQSALRAFDCGNDLFHICCETYYRSEDEGTVKKKWYEIIVDRIESARKDKRVIKIWEELVNENFDNVIGRFRSDFPATHEWFAEILLFSILGFSFQVISVLQATTVSAVYSRKGSLRRMIKESEIPDKDRSDFLRYLEKTFASKRKQ